MAGRYSGCDALTVRSGCRRMRSSAAGLVIVELRCGCAPARAGWRWAGCRRLACSARNRLASYCALADCQVASYARADSYSSSRLCGVRRARPNAQPVPPPGGEAAIRLMFRPRSVFGFCVVVARQYRGTRGVALQRPGVDAARDVGHRGESVVRQEHRHPLAAGAVVAQARRPAARGPVRPAAPGSRSSGWRPARSLRPDAGGSQLRAARARPARRPRPPLRLRARRRGRKGGPGRSWAPQNWKRDGSGKCSQPRRHRVPGLGRGVAGFAGAGDEGGAHHRLEADDGGQPAAHLELRQQPGGTSATEPLSTMTSNGPSAGRPLAPSASRTSTLACRRAAGCRAPCAPVRGSISSVIDALARGAPAAPPCSPSRRRLPAPSRAAARAGPAACALPPWAPACSGPAHRFVRAAEQRDPHVDEGQRLVGQRARNLRA